MLLRLVGGALVAVTVVTLVRRRRHRLTCAQSSADGRASGLIFTGTGCSSGLPLITCSVGTHSSTPVVECRACRSALRNGPGDKNWRNNVGALIRFRRGGELRHVQIDCGKTFRESCVRIYSAHGVTTLDGVLLTHDHADACFGLDELRSLQPLEPVTFKALRSIRCYCDRRTLTRMRHAFPYLFPRAPALPTADLCTCCELDIEPVRAAPSEAARSVQTAAPVGAPAPAEAAGEGSKLVKRFVASLAWESFGAAFEVCEINVCGLPVVTLPVLHGADYTCYGYAFGAQEERAVYLSDYTELLPATEKLLVEWSSNGRQIAVLVLDALRPEGQHPVHASLEQSVQLARRLRPKRTLMVGMGHGLEHHQTNRELRQLWRDEGLDVALAYDGLLVPLPSLDTV